MKKKRLRNICFLQDFLAGIAKMYRQASLDSNLYLLWNSAVATGLEKVSLYSNPKERQCKQCSNYSTIAFISHWQSNAQNSPKWGFNSMWTKNFQMFKLDLEKAEKPEIKLPTSAGSSKSKRVPKNRLLLYWLCQSLWLHGSQQTMEYSQRHGNTRSIYLPLKKSVCSSRSNSQNQTWNNGLVPNWERSKSRLYTVTLLI